QTGHLYRMTVQNGLEKDLVDPMRRLGCQPVRVGAFAGGIPVPAAGNGNARQLVAGRPGAEYHIVRIVIGQSRVAHVLYDPETPERLHRAGRDVIAFHTRRLGGVALLDDDNVDATPGEIHAQVQSDRAAPDDAHRHAAACAHVTSPADPFRW